MSTWCDCLNLWKRRQAIAVQQNDKQGADVAARWVEYWVKRIEGRKEMKPLSFKTRVLIAANCLKSDDGIDTLKYQECFDCGDCDKVIAALVRQCQDDAALYQGIVRNYDGFPKEWIQTAIP